MIIQSCRFQSTLSAGLPVLPGAAADILCALCVSDQLRHRRAAVPSAARICRLRRVPGAECSICLCSTAAPYIGQPMGRSMLCSWVVPCALFVCWLAGQPDGKAGRAVCRLGSSPEVRGAAACQHSSGLHSATARVLRASYRVRSRHPVLAARPHDSCGSSCSVTSQAHWMSAADGAHSCV